MKNNLEEIINYEGNDNKYFQNLDKNLDNESKTEITEIFYDKEKIINIKYKGRGILYTNNGEVEYNGYFKDGKYEGFGRKLEICSNGKALIVGFFKNGFCQKGVMYDEKKIKKYDFNFPEGETGIAIEFFQNGKIKRKMIYEYYYLYLKPLNESYGILYDENNNIIYSGLIKDFKPEKAKNITIYNQKGIKMYTGDISSYKYDGNGILYYTNSEKIYFQGIFDMDNYKSGILYNPDGIQIYEGRFSDNLPFKCKNIKLYDQNCKLLYEGDIEEGKYENYGKLYKDGILKYKGEFLKGKYNKYGELIHIYEGEFLNGIYHGYGKLKGKYEGYFINGLYEGKGILYGNEIIETEFIKGEMNKNAYIKKYKNSLQGKYLYFEGNQINGKIEGDGIIYYKNGNIYFKGNYINGKINGKGIKFYKNGSKKIEGIFKNLNSCEGIYYNPENKPIYEGLILNEIPMNCKSITIYDDYSNKIYEGEIKNGIYNGKGIEYFPFFKDRILYNGEFINNYYIENNLNYNMTDNLSCEITIFTYHTGYHSCELTEKLVTNEVGSFVDMTEGDQFYEYRYQDKNYKLKIHYLNDIYKWKTNPLIFSRKSKIIIIVLDLYKDTYIDENYIEEFVKEKKKNNKLLYIIGKGLKYIEKENLYEIREQAKTLIIENKIDKYFELCLETGEGFEFFKKNLEIDIAIIISKKNFFSKQKKILNKYINF